MKVIILAGGRGTRISEESMTRPKPMVEVGGKPLLWHIMNIYASYGYKDFVVACGYKGEMIKEYFHTFLWRHNDYIIDLNDGSHQVVSSAQIEWRIGLIDTGLDTMTGGRILRLKKWIGEETFMMTYGDGLGNINIQRLVDFHRSHGKLATVTAVHPPARFGDLKIVGNTVCKFAEKPQTGEGWINGGFFVLEPRVFHYIASDQTSFEREPLERLASESQLMAFHHNEFWQPLDTLREKQLLESMWESGNAPWKTWK